MVVPMAGTLLGAVAAATTPRACFIASLSDAVTPRYYINRWLYLHSVSRAINYVCAGRPEERGASARMVAALPASGSLLSLPPNHNKLLFPIIVCPLAAADQRLAVLIAVREPSEVPETGATLHCFTCCARAEQMVCAPERGHKAAHVLGLE